MDNPSDPDMPSLGALDTRRYQQEMLEESLRNNIIIALDTGSGKTHIAVLRMKIEAEREPKKVSWFLAPTVSLCEQQRNVIKTALPVSVGFISGALEPNQWKDPNLWRSVVSTHRIMVTTPQVLLDALRHGYIDIGRDISLLIFDEAHHAVDNDPYNQIMKEFYHASGSFLPGTSEVERPKILGLTASPIFGGDVTKAFMTIEANLDSVIRTPRLHREELSNFVHRPTFKHALYAPPDYINPPFSYNVAALQSVIATMDIEDDPYVLSLREQLKKLPPGPDQVRLDQKLSKTIQKENSYTHRGLKDFARAAAEICVDIGPWAADWYIETVLEKAKLAAAPYKTIISAWQDKEKAYLLDHLNKVVTTSVSYDPQDIVAGTSAKLQALVRCLQDEKANTEAYDESYSGLIFVTRRDAVITLAEVLSHHPLTKDLFRIGYLLGTSDSAYRHSFLDITRTLQRQPQEETLSDFKIGEKNLIISTSVAEEGIDIQACGSVIRWNPPANMASWAQSRGRARRKRSTFTLMFENGGAHERDVAEWERLEQEMVDLYNNSQRELAKKLAKEDSSMIEDDDDGLEFRIESTGALLTLNSAISHLSHFCSVIPNSSHVAHNPIYDIDPPDLPYGWHSFREPLLPYAGLYGSTVTLPRLLPPHLRVFSTARVHTTKISAHRHVAFKAYRTLYQEGLLNDNLLPLSSVIEPEEDITAILKDVEKRSGTAGVSGQMDPWAVADGAIWWSSELAIDGIPLLRMFTRSRPKSFTRDEPLPLYRTGCAPIKYSWRPLKELDFSTQKIELARHYTRRLFWVFHGGRMNWDDLDFSYLFLPAEQEVHWDIRRSWLHEQVGCTPSKANVFNANAELFGTKFSFPSDLTVIRNGTQFSKAFRFLRWQFDPISLESEDDIRKTYSQIPDLKITYPLLVVQPFSTRMNFLHPTPPPPLQPQPAKHVPSILVPRLSTALLFSSVDTEFAILLPSILRSLSVILTASSLRDTLLADSPVSAIPLGLLTLATTAPVAQGLDNYQRLETLGDTVLKFIVGIQLLSEHPHWHEGYLSRKKDHAVSNVRLAKDALAKELYQWIIRDRFVPKRWKPAYFSTILAADDDLGKTDAKKENADPKKPHKDNQQLSTKVLADVVESLIGAAYLHGSFDLAVECARIFGLGLSWQKLPQRLEAMISRLEHYDDFPTQITDVERILGYKFTHRLLLVEALTHASHQHDLRTVSYERLEFLGDSVLDMIVTDYLYHAPGKKYSPGHIHLRRSALVNMHLLSYICLRSTLTVDAAMPGRDGNRITLKPEQHHIHLWQCLLHSSHRILDDQNNTFARFRRGRAKIEEALNHGSIFPWAELTRLQSPKFLSDMVESLIGAVYLDSRGDLDVVRRVLRALGIFQILERMVQADVDVLHPVSRLALWAARLQKKVDYNFRTEKGEVSCAILVDEEEVVRVGELYRGRASREEVKYMAAEEVIKIFRLHTAPQDKKKRPPKKKKVPA